MYARQTKFFVHHSRKDKRGKVSVVKVECIYILDSLNACSYHSALFGAVVRSEMKRRIHR